MRDGENSPIAQSISAMAKLSKGRKTYDGPQQMEYWWFRHCLGNCGCRVLGDYAEQEFGASSWYTLRWRHCDCSIRLSREGGGSFGNHASRGCCGWHP